MSREQTSHRPDSQPEARPGVVVSRRTWIPTAEQLAALEAAWAPCEAMPVTRAAIEVPSFERHA